ncbi:MAG: hypothetical protein HYS55_05245 [Candidatus Omnitrophica bacterium]|nr:hypothetical protein [Candidatus Omnitrophota bacterium]
MNTKRWFLAGLGAFLVVSVLDMIVHGRLLMGLYTQTQSVWRQGPDGGHLMWLIFLTEALFAFALAWFYTLGYEVGKPALGQGIRFGFYIGIVLVAAQGFTWYAVLPVPFILNLGWLASSMVNSLAAGAVIGLIYRK